MMQNQTNNLNNTISIFKGPRLKSRINYLKKMALIYIVSLSVFFIIDFIISNQATNSEDQARLMQTQINQINANISSLERQNAEIKTAAELWNNMTIKNKKRDGLKIDEAKNLLNSIKQTYYLSDSFSVNMTPPVELVEYRTSNVTIMSSQVDITFGGITDDLILNFVDDTIQSMPGFITIKQFSMVREADITKDLIVRISGGDIPNVITAKLSFDWKDFRDIK